MKFVAATLFAILCLASASTAFAHAEEPNAQRLVFTDDGWVLQANFGVVESTSSNRLVCEEAYLGGEGWKLAVLGQTEWITFGETSAQRTTDGCTFEKVATLPDLPTDTAADPVSGSVAYLMNTETDGGLWVSTDRGQTFENIPGVDVATNQLTGVRFLDDDTLIVSGYQLGSNGAPSVWRVTISTAEVTALTPPDGTTYPYVLAAEGGHVILLARRDVQMLFWGTPDSLDTAEVELGSWPTGATLSADGTSAWVSGADMSRGVLVGTLAGDTASWETVIPDTIANCVEHEAGATYVCSLNRLHEFDLVELLEDGTTRGVVNFREFEGVRQCPAGSTVADVCPVVWREISSYFGVDPNAGDMGPGPGDMGVSSDAGGQGWTPDTDVPNFPGEMDEPASGCCTTVQTHESHGEWLVPLLLGLLVSVRARWRAAA